MTDTNRTAAPATPIETLGDNKLVRNTVFVGASLVALGTAVASIWQEFYSEIVNQEPFKALRENRDREKGNVRASVDTWGHGKVKTELKAVDARYTEQVTQALEKQNISSKFLRGTMDRLEQLGRFDKLTIAMKTGASLAVTLGTYYLINQNVRLKASNKYQDDRLKDLGDRIDAAENKRQEAYSRM